MEANPSTQSPGLPQPVRRPSPYLVYPSLFPEQLSPRAKTCTSSVDTTTTVTTTLPQETDTFYSTSTIESTTISTFFDTTTQTVLETATTTTGGLTSTVTTNAGYIPIQSVSGNPPSRKRRVEGHARRVPAPTPVAEPTPVEFDIEKRSKQPLCVIKNGNPYTPNKYPNYVSCQSNIKVVTTKVATKTARWTITKTAKAPTSYVTKTSTHTTSTTVLAVRASTTITSFIIITIPTSTTSTLTEMETTTITETVTTVPTATVYSACDNPANYISRRNGRGIQVVTAADGNTGSTISSSAVDAADCCRQCFARSNCGGMAFYQGSCFLFQVNTCLPENVMGNYRAPNDFNVPGYTLSNGNCVRLRWDQQV